jgi:phosphoglycolate phosphatase-like HAD superfamily hydrolase
MRGYKKDYKSKEKSSCMKKGPENVALFDMDGTLCDYDKSLFNFLESLKSPDEQSYNPLFRSDIPLHIKARMDLIRASEEWWANLPKLQLGWDVLEVARVLEYRIMILTQGSRRNPASWAGKKQWIDRNLGQDIDVTMTRDKSLVYGKVLVDDYPEYIESWLEWRKRGLVIMPANDANKDFKHKQVIRYDGRNLDEVAEAMLKVSRAPCTLGHK